MKNGKYPLVLVEWQDAAIADRWRDIEEVQAEGQTVACTSVGWLIQDNTERLILGAQLDNEGECGLRVTIPKVCVKSITPLRTRAKSEKVVSE